ncbi:Uncharacterized protein FKW44_001419, partial [Caligus rogercresseyi]
MKKTLLRLSLGELRAECLSLELCTKEEVTGKRKADLIPILREHLLFCGCDPGTFDFADAPPGEAGGDPEVPAPSSHLGVSQPPPFSLSGPRRGHRWAAWADEFEIYVTLFGDLSPERKKALLLHCAGPEVQQWWKSLQATPRENEDVYRTLRRTMEDTFSPVDSILFERYRLSETKQIVGEPLDDFVTRLRIQARFCKLSCSSCNAPNEEDAIVGAMLKNTTSPRLRQMVFEKKISQLNEVLQLGRALENADIHAKEMNKEGSAFASEYKGPKGTLRSKPFPKLRSPKSHTQPSHKPGSIKCKFCGRMHPPTRSQCPAVGKVCLKCNGPDHFASCCKSGQSSLIEGELAAASFKSSSRPFVKACLKGRAVKFLLDLGANVNILPRELVPEKLISQHPGQIKVFGGNGIPILGTVTLPLFINNSRSRPLEFLITDVSQPILGSQACLDLGLVSLHKPSFMCHQVLGTEGNVEALNKKFGHLFGDSGPQTVNHTKAVVHLKENSKPRYLRSRPVPLALRDKVKEELLEMIRRGTLERVESSEWASPIVTVMKPDGNVRICADYTQTISPVINKCLYPLPHPEELFGDLAGSKFFTKLDFRRCYEQYELDEQSKGLLVINTPLGLLKYNVLPYGLSSAPAIVQSAQERLLGDIPNVKVYIDDLLIHSKSLAEHIATLKCVYERLDAAGARLKRSKCIFAAKELTYLGFKVSELGKSPDKELVRPVMEFPTPSSPSGVKSFLGLVQFYSQFLKDLSSTATPLYELTRPSVDFSWTSEAEVSFNKIKQHLSKAPVLAHYDPALPLYLTTDASPIGLGAILSNVVDGIDRPIAFASRKLTPAERNYSQIDREATGIIFGLNRFERYLLGRHFAIKSDHKPLEFILNPQKELPAVVSARLSRYALRLAEFDYSISHIKGSSNLHSDALSRGPLDDPLPMEDPVDKLMCLAISSNNCNTEDLLSAMSQDETLSRVVEAAKNNSWSKVNDLAFKKKRDSFSVKDDLLFWGIRLVVPSSLRRKFLNELHLSHRGIIKMKSVARSTIWWPKIDLDIENLVNTCVTCQREAPSPPAKFIPFLPANPWERVHIDYLQFKKKNYLILMDSGSKWIEAAPMSDTSTSHTLQKLLYWFTRFGFPRQLHSDNGPQFSNPSFKSKMSEWGVELSFSPPYHPQSNGQAERAVRIVKDLLRKNPDLSIDELLFTYRSTPLACGKSPAELIFAWPIRTRLDGYLPRRKSPTKERIVVKSSVWCRSYNVRQPKWVPGETLNKISNSIWS